MAELHALLEQLRRGERPALGRDEFDALVTWLCGAADRDRDDAEKILPSPGHDPVLLQMVFYRLDATLFNGSELNLAAAGLDDSQPEKLRKVRFRRLAGAFHPDRYPELADWLTARSQIVLQAYGHFKHPRSETPSVDLVPASTDARQAPSDMRPRGRPRRSKKRLRGFMLRLRQRFGNDRYLAHKLVGGLAVIALLPVLNLLLAPGQGTVDSGTGGEAAVDGGDATVDGLRFTVDAGGGEEEAFSVFRFPFSGEKPGAAAEDGGNGVPGGSDDGVEIETEGSNVASIAENGKRKTENAGEDRSPETRIATTEAETTDPEAPARTAENGKRKTENAASSAAEITPLLAAARRAMNPGGYPAPVTTLPSVDEQLAAMGLESDTERLYRRMGDEKKGTVDGGEATVDGLRFTVDGEKREESERVAGVVGANRAGEGEALEENTFSVFRFPFSGEKAEVAAEGGGNGSTGAGNALESHSGEPGLATIAENGKRKTENADDDRRPETRVTTTEAETTDPEGPARTAEKGKRKTENAGDDRRPETRIATTEAETTDPEGPARTAENGKRKTESTDDDRSPETRIATAETETTNPESPARKPSTVNRQPSRDAPPALEPGKLALGPMASSAPGKLLAGLRDDLEQGNLVGLMSRFSSRARHGELSGLDEIATHYRALFERVAPRQVDLSARRIDRDGEGWRVEAVLAVRGYHRGRPDRALETVFDQRIVMQLAERDRRLQITRLEQ